jgi:hypothetical protein
VKKIRLSVESLKVLSFETGQLAGRRGTVRGAQTMFGRCQNDVDANSGPTCIVGIYSGEDPTCIDGCQSC